MRSMESLYSNKSSNFSALHRRKAIAARQPAIVIASSNDVRHRVMSARVLRFKQLQNQLEAAHHTIAVNRVFWPQLWLVNFNIFVGTDEGQPAASGTAKTPRFCTVQVREFKRRVAKTAALTCGRDSDAPDEGAESAEPEQGTDQQVEAERCSHSNYNRPEQAPDSAEQGQVR